MRGIGRLSKESFYLGFPPHRIMLSKLSSRTETWHLCEGVLCSCSEKRNPSELI